MGQYPTKLPDNFCPIFLNPYPRTDEARWLRLNQQFDFTKIKPIEIKTKPLAEQDTQRKYLQPLFDVLTDYVNDNTQVLPIVRALDLAVSRTNKMIRNKSVMAQEWIHDVGAGDEKSYRVKMKIVMKGGNLLRIYYLLYIDIVPLHFFRSIEKQYAKYFKKSDLDFEFVLVDQANPKRKVYVNPKNVKGQKFLNMITYHVLNEYRNIMYGEKSFNHITFCGESVFAPKTRDHLNTLLDDLTEAQQDLLDDEKESIFKHSKLIGIVIGSILYPTTRDKIMLELQNGVNKNYYNDETQFRTARRLLRLQGSFRPDIYVDARELEKDEFERQMDVYPITYNENATSQQGSNLFITVHRQLHFVDTAPDGTSVNKIFTLGRIMLNAILLFYDETTQRLIPTKLRGEIIDLASSYSEDIKLELTKVLLPLDDIFGTKNVSIFNVQTLIDDLEFMLFRGVEYPWFDKKYEKRLVRLLFFRWITLLESETPASEFMETMRLDESITVNNFDTHPMMRDFKLVLPTAAKTRYPKELEAFINVVDAFRSNIRDMITTQTERRDTPFTREDIPSLLKLRKKLVL